MGWTTAGDADVVDSGGRRGGVRGVDADGVGEGDWAEGVEVVVQELGQGGEGKNVGFEDLQGISCWDYDLREEKGVGLGM